MDRKRLWPARFVLFWMFTWACVPFYGQGFKVKEFKQNLNDGSAFHAPVDSGGHPCGLIKVRTNNPDLRFFGGIVGDVENKMNEYWVYVSQDCSSLKICHPHFLPMVIDFVDYDLSISSKATYVLTLEEGKFNKEKTGLSVVVKPEDAKLYINKVLIDDFDGSGLYQLFLSKGDYVCELKKAGYNTYAQLIQMGKASQIIDVELESLMANLDIKSKTNTAEIYVDGVLKGNGAWNGELLPGEHEIEARQNNFVSHVQNVTLAEKERRTIVIPELKRTKGRLNITTKPVGMPIYLDGSQVGVSPCSVEVETGPHYVECKNIDGCKDRRIEVNVKSGEPANVSVPIEFVNGRFGVASDYQKAYNGDLDTILQFACNACDTNRQLYDEAFYWIKRLPGNEDVIFNWHEYGLNRGDALRGWWRCNWVQAFEYIGQTEKAKKLRSQLEKLRGSSDERLKWYLEYTL